MPPNFKFPQHEELWVPLYNEFPLKPRGDPTSNGAQVMGRLKPGVSLDQANAEFIGLAKRIAKDNPKTNKHLTSASVQPLLRAFTGPQLRQIDVCHARRRHCRPAHRLCECDEHAVRPGRVARQ